MATTDATSTAEPDLSPNAHAVLSKRYLLRDEAGHVVETPGALVRRVAKAVAASEARHAPGAGAEAETRVAAWEDRFARALLALEFLPNSPTLMNAGTPLGNLAACFVLPVPDDLEGVFDAVRRMALVHKTGGGTGFSFSRLRPKDDVVGSTGGAASGPVPFMQVFDAATEAVRQGGRRRGANMAILRADHPDILEFIHAKTLEGRLRNFNISVGATDAFLRAAAEGGAYALRNPRTGALVREAPARDVLEAIVDAAWRTGDPGLVFLDAISRANPTPHLGEIEATNPCGEMPLLPFEACNLGSLSLPRFVVGSPFDAPATEPASAASFAPAAFSEARIAWERLGDAVETAVRFLDDAIDASRYPFPEIDAVVRANRKIGLGVMGFAEMLIRLGVPYASERALTLADEVMAFIEARAVRASRELAAVRGAFPAFALSRLAERGLPPQRNATVTSIAPTGTISIIAAVSSGIEPLYAIAFARNVLDGEELLDVNPLFERAARRLGVWSPELARRILAEGSIAHNERIPQDLRRLFPTAADVPPDAHVRVQAAFQRRCDNGVSKTINLPAEATREDVRRAYLLAWELGCKGITVYRDGSKGTQVLERRDGEAARRLLEGEDGSVCKVCAG